MKTASILSIFAALILVSYFGYIALSENPFEATGTYFSLKWSQGTIIDVLVGLLIFYTWVWYRENSLSRALLWFIPAIIFGNVTTLLYLFFAFKNSGGNVQRFFLGKRGKM